jgi:Clostripain family
MWTVMVFMGADGVEGNKELAAEARADIEEMKRVPRSDTLNILVQLNGAGAPKRHYIVGKGEWDEEPVSASDPSDFANGFALLDFIQWALRKANHDPKEPKHYSILVLWGHAYRFAIGHTETQAGIDALDFAELASVLAVFQERVATAYNLKDPPKLDIVGFDACELATIEMARQLAPYAKYLLSSQLGIPLPGWPYDRVLSRLAKPLDRLMGPAEFGSWTVRRYCEFYRPFEQVVSLSHLDLSHARKLSRLTDQLARALAIAMDDDAAELEVVSRLFELAQTAAGAPFVDVVSLCRHLMRYSGSAQVRTAAKALGDALFGPRSTPGGKNKDGALKSETGECKPFVVEYGSNSCEGAALHGVSLYAPHIASGRDLGEASHFYEKFVFAKDTLWRELVHALSLPNKVCC